MILLINAQNAGLNLMSDFVPTYLWNLSDLIKIDKKNVKVFSTFACGGGSTMGYKLAGCDVVGANEIDPEMAYHYKLNHDPKYFYLEDIRKLRQRDDLPKELYQLDILDGSPPCSSFSMAGNRDKEWGKKKVFREGQSSQILDDLFFEYIELVRKLRPKVFIAENVKGMIQGKAKGYVKEILGLFKVAGYKVQLFLLDASSMGLPQRRERVFFIGRQNDLNLPDLKLSFMEAQIPLIKAFLPVTTQGPSVSSSTVIYKYWHKTKEGYPLSTAHEKNHLFTVKRLSRFLPSLTLTATFEALLHYDTCRYLSMEELAIVSSFPQDYKFKNYKLAGYMMGMSVPPLMTYKITKNIIEQWKLGENLQQ